MKGLFILLAGVLLSFASASAQRVIDAADKTPISTASILDASGNMVGFTWNDGHFSEIPKTAYPVTVRCLGYEHLVVETPEDRTWEMIPKDYELDEVVIVPIDRNVLKLTFYVREYFGMSSQSDTVTSFIEHMAVRFVPTTKDAKFGGNSSLKILDSRYYSRYKVHGKDSVITDSESMFPSMMTVLEHNDDEVVAPESFKDAGNSVKLYEKRGKSGMSLVQKQNADCFTEIRDGLASKKDHSYSPWFLKLLGLSMNFKKLYMTHTYGANDNGVYSPKDLVEAGFVMEADGSGKLLRKMLDSDKPIAMRSMVELYVVDRKFLSNDEAKKEYRNKKACVEFVIPATVPPLDNATRRLVERAKANLK